MGEESENTLLYIIWVDGVQLYDAAHPEVEVVLRCYADQTNDCSEAFVIGGGVSSVNPGYVAFMVVSFEDAAADRSKALMMTLSEANGAAHLAYQGLDVSSFSWDSTFKEEWVDLQTEAGESVASVHIRSGAVPRQSEETIVPSAEASFVKPDSDGQARMLWDFIASHGGGQEDEGADGDDSQKDDGEQERAAEAETQATRQQEERRKKEEEEKARQRREEEERHNEEKRRQDDEHRRKEADLAREQERRQERERAQRERSQEREVRERELNRAREEKDSRRMDDDERWRSSRERELRDLTERERFRREEDLQWEESQERKEKERRHWEARREALRQHAKQERLREKDERHFRAQERRKHVEVTASRLSGDGALSTPRGGGFDSSMSTPHGNGFAGHEHMLTGSRGGTPRQYHPAMPLSEPQYDAFSDRVVYRSDHRDHYHVDHGVDAHRPSLTSSLGLGEHLRTHDHAHRQYSDSKRYGAQARHYLAHPSRVDDHLSEGSDANLFDEDDGEQALVSQPSEMISHGRGRTGTRARSQGAYHYTALDVGNGRAMSSTKEPLSARLEQLKARSNEVDVARGPWRSDSHANDGELILNDGFHESNSEMHAPRKTNTVTKMQQTNSNGRKTGLRHHHAHSHSHRSVPKKRGELVSEKEARAPGTGSPAARSIVAAALNDAIAAETTVEMPIRVAPTEAVENGIMRIVQLQKQLNKAGDSPGHAALTEAAAGLVPHMLHILQVAREVSEENRSMLRDSSGSAKNISVQLDRESADYLQAQLDALQKLHSQYARLLPKDDARCRSSSHDNSFRNSTHVVEEPSVFHRRLQDLERLEAGSAKLREAVFQPNLGQSHGHVKFDSNRSSLRGQMLDTYTPMSLDFGGRSPSNIDCSENTPRQRTQIDPGGPPAEVPRLQASCGSSPPVAKFREMRDARINEDIQLSLRETMEYLSQQQVHSATPSSRSEFGKINRLASTSPSDSFPNEQNLDRAQNGVIVSPRSYASVNSARHTRARDIPQVPLRMAYQRFQGASEEFVPPRRTSHQRHDYAFTSSTSPERLTHWQAKPMSARGDNRPQTKDKYLMILEKLQANIAKGPLGSKILDGSLSARSPRRGYR